MCRSPALFHLRRRPVGDSPRLCRSAGSLPGGFWAHYGRSIAGIVEVRSRPAKGDRLSGKIDVDLLDSGFRLEGPVAGRKDLSFGLSGRRSYIDVLLPLATSVVGGPGEHPTDLLGLSGATRLQKGGTRAGVRMYGYDDVLVLAATDDDAARRNGEPPGLGIHGGVHRLVADGRQALQTAGSRGWSLGYQFTGGEFGEDIYWDAGIYELGIRSDLKYSFSKRRMSSLAST